MTKYEIRVIYVEMKKSDYANYGTAFDKFNNSTNQEPYNTYEYDNEEEARKNFDEMNASCLRNHGGCGVSYDLCIGLILVHIEYDDDGDFVCEEWIDYKFEDRTTEGIAEEDDEA